MPVSVDKIDIWVVALVLDSQRKVELELLQNRKSQKINKVEFENNFKTICLIFIKLSAAETNED